MLYKKVSELIATYLNDDYIFIQLSRQTSKLHVPESCRNLALSITKEFRGKEFGYIHVNIDSSVEKVQVIEKVQERNITMGLLTPSKLEYHGPDFKDKNVFFYGPDIEENILLFNLFNAFPTSNLLQIIPADDRLPAFEYLP